MLCYLLSRLLMHKHNPRMCWNFEKNTSTVYLSSFFDVLAAGVRDASHNTDSTTVGNSAGHLGLAVKFTWSLVLWVTSGSQLEQGKGGEMGG